MSKFWKAEIAWREVELFKVERVVGNVHLAVHPFQLSVVAEDHGGVVIQALRALLEKRTDDHDS